MRNYLTARKGESPLFQTIIDNDFINFKKIIASGYDVEKKNDEGFTPLQLARYLGRTPFIQELFPTPPPWILVEMKGKSKECLLNEAEYEKYFGVKYLPSLTFSDVKQLYTVKRLIDRKVRRWYELSDLSTNPYFYIANKLSNAEVAATVIRWIDEEMGFGLFAGADFELGEFICEYTGYVENVSLFFGKKSNYALSYLFSYFPLKKVIVNAKIGGNAARFINHSINCNVQVVAAIDDVLVHPVIFATQSIAKGDQLFLDYGNDGSVGF